CDACSGSPPPRWRARGADGAPFRAERLLATDLSCRASLHVVRCASRRSSPRRGRVTAGGAARPPRGAAREQTLVDVASLTFTPRRGTPQPPIPSPSGGPGWVHARAVGNDRVESGPLCVAKLQGVHRVGRLEACGRTPSRT